MTGKKKGMKAALSRTLLDLHVDENVAGIVPDRVYITFEQLDEDAISRPDDVASVEQCTGDVELLTTVPSGRVVHVYMRIAVAHLKRTHALIIDKEIR